MCCAKQLQLCPILCDPVDCSPPGSSVHGVLQVRILEWVVISSSSAGWMNEYPANVSPGKSSLGSFSVSVSRGRSLKADSFIHFCACSPGLPRWLSGKKKNPPANVGDAGDSSLIPGSGRSPGGGNDNPLQYSCLENPMARGAWQTTPHKKAMSLTRLSTHMHVCVVIVVQLLSSMWFFCNPMDCNLSDSSVHGKWVAISFSRASSQTRNWTHVSHWQADSLPLNHRGSSLTCSTYHLIGAQAGQIQILWSPKLLLLWRPL